MCVCREDKRLENREEREGGTMGIRRREDEERRKMLGKERREKDKDVLVEGRCVTGSRTNTEMERRGMQQTTCEWVDGRGGTSRCREWVRRSSSAHVNLLPLYRCVYVCC